MRILLTIHHHLNPDSGAAGVTWQLAHALRQLGHEVATFSWDDLPDRMSPREREVAFAFYTSARIRRDRSVDIIDASTGDAWPYLVARRTQRAPGPAVIARSHGLEHTFHEERRREARRTGGDLPMRERLYHGQLKLWEGTTSMRLSDATLFLNTLDRKRAITTLGVAPSRAHIVANGVPDAWLTRSADQKRAPGQGLRVAMIGGFDPQKGFAYAFAAIGQLLDEGTDVTLTTLGTGAPKHVVAAGFPAHHRQHLRVHPHYSRHELPDFLAEHDVVLLPSLSEGFSLALIEAMACALTPVASAVGAAPDLLTHGENGFLVPPRDEAAIAEALRRLAASRELTERLGRAAQETARAYGWTTVATSLSETYEQVLDDRARPTTSRNLR